MTVTTGAVALKAATVQRVLARRNKPKYREARDELNDRLFRMKVEEPEIAAPQTAAEWLDDQLIRVPAGTPGGAFMLELGEAARTGDVKAAVAVVKQARSLDCVTQFAVRGILTGWRLDAAPAGTRELVGAVVAEWRRLGLQTDAPSQAQLYERDRQRLAAMPPLPARRPTDLPPVPAGLSWARSVGVA